MSETQSKTYQDQHRLALFGLAAELPNFVVVTISAILSSSLLMWLDVIDSTGNVLNAWLVTIISKKLKSNLKYEYNYGVGKIESISSLCVDSLSLTGLVVIMVYAIHDIIYQEDPGQHLLIPILLKAVNIICDAIYAYAQHKILKSSDSLLSKSEFDQALRATLFDLVTFVSLVITWIFNNSMFSTYFSPIVSLILAIYYFIHGIKNIIHSITILTDKTLPEDEQMKILKVLNKHYDEYDDLIEIDSHLSGTVALIDIQVRFTSDTPYEKIQSFASKMDHEINEVIPNSVVHLIIKE